MSFDLPGVKPGSDIETLFKAVGFITVQWGFAEQALDLMVAAIFNSFEGHPALSKRRPQFLEPKVELLEKCFAEIQELSQFRPEIEPLLARFSSSGKRRNELIHGAISGIEIKDDSFMFLKVDLKQNEHHIRPVFLEASDWPEFRTELLRLGRDGQALAQRVWDSLKERT
jgi:hypothetical protein